LNKKYENKKAVRDDLASYSAVQAAGIKNGIHHFPNRYRISITIYPNGGFQITRVNPGRVPGSKAIYVHEFDALGNTISAKKTTIDNKGQVASVKDKIVKK
jgi:hypothetical protein